MPFLVIGGMTVKASLDGQQRNPLQRGTRRRSVDLSMRSSISTAVVKQTWRGRTVALSQAEAQQLESILTGRVNLVTAPRMDVDSNSDGVVDGFNTDSNPSVTPVYTFDAVDGAQRIQITGSTGAGVAQVQQTISGFEAGEVVSVSADTRFDSLVGVTGEIVGVWLDITGTAIISVFQVTGLTNTSWTRHDTENQVAPTNAIHLQLILRLRAGAAGNTGSGRFRDVQVERGSAHYGFTDNSQPVTAFGDFIRGVGYTGAAHNTARNVFPELISVTPLYHAGTRRFILDFVLHEA